MTLRPPLRLLFCAGALGATHLLRSAEPVLTGPTVELDKFVITSVSNYQPIETGWQVGEVPGFRIFSHGNSAAKSVTEQLQLAREAFGLVWDKAPLRQLVTVVVTADEPEFLRWANISPAAMDRTTAMVSSPTGTVLLVNGGNDTVHRAVGRAYVLALLRDSKLPRWLQEGLAQITNSVEASGSSLIVGKVRQDERNTVSVEALQQVNGMLKNDQPGAASGGRLGNLDDARFLKNTRGDQVEVTLDGRTATAYELEQHTREELLRRQEERYTYSGTSDFLTFLSDSVVFPLEKTFGAATPDTVAWRMNAWAFTHYSLFGENKKWRPAFFQFVQQLEKQPERAPTEVFRDVFKTSPGKFELDLTLYARNRNYAVFDFKLAEPFRATVLNLSAVPEANVLQLKARVFVATQREDEARRLLAAGYVNPENRTTFYVQQFAQLLRPVDRGRSAEILEDAARREKLDATGNRLLAESRLDRLTGKGNKLSPDDLRMVLLPLFAALDKGDQSEDTFVLIGKAWSASTVPPKPEHLNALRLGLTLHPKSQQLTELLKQLEKA
ncbi:hypothetical protein [Oleiharenicola lentus]|uniref:hypothetical protein n=1 Tax=Oleiharenicola lentus TaxID=2508720 RepID=UPI003F664F95